MKKQITYRQNESEKTFTKNDFYPGDIPAKAGVYIFRDRFSRIIYIGKAANLRKRVSSYFQPSRRKTADPKLRSLINSIHTYEYYPVNNESESLILESHLIKEYSPRYNVLMRDDKRFLMIKINLADTFPSLKFARLRKNDGALYFGPFPKGAALRKTVDFLVKKHGLKICRANIPTEKDRKHCQARIAKDCCEPCIGKTSETEYRDRVDDLMKILNGNIKEAICEIRTKMDKHGLKMQYEKAAECRDIIDNIEEIFGKKNRSFRFAKIAGSENTEKALNSLGKILDLPHPPAWVECFDISNIGGSLAVAGMVCFRNGKPDKNGYRRFRIRGSYTKTDKKLKDYPMGTGGDDFAMIAEAISRRYSRIIKNIRKKETVNFPDLIIVDGGKGQLNAALGALKKLNTPFIPLIGLAKKNEEIFIPGRRTPVIIDSRQPALKLLQEIRDETHRFAISYHRKLRNSRIEASILDDIPGIGAKRKKVLLKTFGSLKKLREASPSDISAKVPGIGKELAEKIANV